MSNRISVSIMYTLNSDLRQRMRSTVVHPSSLNADDILEAFQNQHPNATYRGFKQPKKGISVGKA